jgi:hypothetical protein
MKHVENMWVQSRLVEGGLVGRQVQYHDGRDCILQVWNTRNTIVNTIRCSHPILSLSYSVIHGSHTTRGTWFQ